MKNSKFIIIPFVTVLFTLQIVSCIDCKAQKVISINQSMCKVQDTSITKLKAVDTLTLSEKKWVLGIAESARGNYSIPADTKISIFKDDNIYSVIYNNNLKKGERGSDYYLKILINEKGNVVKTILSD